MWWRNVYVVSSESESEILPIHLQPGGWGDSLNRDPQISIFSLMSSPSRTCLKCLAWEAPWWHPNCFLFWPKWKPSSHWLSLAILSLKVMNRISNKGQSWWSSTCSGKESDSNSPKPNPQGNLNSCLKTTGNHNSSADRSPFSYWLD